jgi:membrane protein YqaA with SNARE-associated domain
MGSLDIAFVLKVSAISGAFGGGISWILQKLIEQRFAKRLENHRHKNALAAQDEKIRLDLYNRRFEIFSSVFDFYEALRRIKRRDFCFRRHRG